MYVYMCVWASLYVDRHSEGLCAPVIVKQKHCVEYVCIGRGACERAPTAP